MEPRRVLDRYPLSGLASSIFLRFNTVRQRLVARPREQRHPKNPGDPTFSAVCFEREGRAG